MYILLKHIKYEEYAHPFGCRNDEISEAVPLRRLILDNPGRLQTKAAPSSPTKHR